MYKRIISKKRGDFVYIAILAAIFIVIYGNYVFAADKRFKSEEDLLDETRANVEKHLNDQQEAKSSAAAKEKAKSNTAEEPIVIKEEQEKTTQAEPAVEEKSLVQEKYAEGIPSDVMSFTLTNNKTDNSANQQSSAEEIDIS